MAFRDALKTNNVDTTLRYIADISINNCESQSIELNDSLPKGVLSNLRAAALLYPYTQHTDDDLKKFYRLEKATNMSHWKRLEKDLKKLISNSYKGQHSNNNLLIIFVILFNNFYNTIYYN